MKISKRNKIIFGTGILLIVIVLIASSYAYWQLVRTQTDENEIATGCFDVTYTEESAAINLEDAYPITDEEGMEGDPYTFTIKNTCGMYALYQINLEILPVAGDRLSSEYVRVGLNNKVYTMTSTNEVSPTIEDALESYKLINGGLKKNQEKTFDLRLWMDEDTTLAEGSNKFFKSKITVIAIAGEEPIMYSTSFGSTTNEEFHSVTSTPDGGYVSVGTTSATSKSGDFLLTSYKGTLRGSTDALILKYDKKGNLMWSNSFGSTAADYFSSVISTIDGGFIAVGNTSAISKSGDFSLASYKGTLRGSQDALIVKYDANGNLVWSNSFGSTVQDSFQSISLTSDGGFIVVGNTNATTKSGDFSLASYKGTLRGGQDGIIVKYDANGNLVWSNSFGSTANDAFKSGYSTLDDGYIAVGNTGATSANGDFLTNHKGILRGSADALVVKYDANGNLVWSNSFGSTSSDQFNSVTATSDDGFVAAGNTDATILNGDFSTNHKGTLRGAQDALIVKYDSSGNLVWSNNFGSIENEFYWSMDRTSDDGFIAVGTTNATSKDGDLLTNHKGILRGSADALVVKYDANGNLVWSNSFGSTSGDIFISVSSTSDGGFVTSGYTDASSKNSDFLINFKGTLYGGTDGLIVKFDSEGYFTQEP